MESPRDSLRAILNAKLMNGVASADSPRAIVASASYARKYRDSRCFSIPRGRSLEPDETCVPRGRIPA